MSKKAGVSFRGFCGGAGEGRAESAGVLDIR